MAASVSTWRSEHRVFGALLALLEQQIERLHEAAAPDFEVMFDVVDYMIDYVDRFHHPREDLAFAKIAEHAPAVREVIDRLAADHAELPRMGRALGQEIEAVIGGNVVARDVLEQQIRRYLEAFRRHMYTEEQEIFPLALECLSEQDWEQIRAQLGGGSDPLLAERPAERYRALRKELRDVDLSG